MVKSIWYNFSELSFKFLFCFFLSQWERQYASVSPVSHWAQTLLSFRSHVCLFSFFLRLVSDHWDCIWWGSVSAWFLLWWRNILPDNISAHRAPSPLCYLVENVIEFSQAWFHIHHTVYERVYTSKRFFIFIFSFIYKKTHPFSNPEVCLWCFKRPFPSYVCAWNPSLWNRKSYFTPRVRYL